MNPLSIAYQTKSKSLPWEEVFKNPELPLIVDAGSGCGRFALLAAKNDATPINYLGTEIRRPVTLDCRCRLMTKHFFVVGGTCEFLGQGIGFE